MDVRAPTLEEISAARARLGNLIVQTPVWRWRGDEIEKAAGTQPFLKLEPFQHAGRFKPRGALTAMLDLPPGKLARGPTPGDAGKQAMAGGQAAPRPGPTRQVGGPRAAQ